MLCSEQGEMTVYIRVKAFLPWIMGKLQQYGYQLKPWVFNAKRQAQSPEHKHELPNGNGNPSNAYFSVPTILLAMCLTWSWNS